MTIEATTRDDILRRVEDIFYAGGTYLVSMPQLIDHLRTTRATFYRHFGSKEALIVAYLGARDREVRNQLTEIVAGRSGRQPVIDVFTALERKTSAEDFRGCAFLLAAIENPHVKAIQSAVLDHKIFLKDFFYDVVRCSAGENLAEQLLLLYEGAQAISAVRCGEDPARIAKSLASMLMSSSVGAE